MPIMLENQILETGAAVQSVRRTSDPEPVGAILARIFTDPTPCCGCGLAVPTFRDRETGRCFCLECLEDAVTASQIELLYERQDAARLAACFGQLAL